ncbi:hypothetical protein ACFQL1_01750 [Halomicroarcula sp. GCM10025709]|uniref:DUF5789 family protein n=1 Tax=Haloarcula TaxID=2237 RepID=UPI0024C2F08B|nr:hypothetical protein [Halomicroarcula sp. YJ-61-S]
MTEPIKLTEITAVLSTFDYPTTPEEVAADHGDIVVELADGSVTLGETIQDADTDSFTNAEDLELTVRSLLPRNAVGEPYQSEGDA